MFKTVILFFAALFVSQASFAFTLQPCPDGFQQVIERDHDGKRIKKICCVRTKDCDLAQGCTATTTPPQQCVNSAGTACANAFISNGKCCANDPQ